jgi:hypothetical protein
MMNVVAWKPASVEKMSYVLVVATCQWGTSARYVPALLNNKRMKVLMIKKKRNQVIYPKDGIIRKNSKDE